MPKKKKYDTKTVEAIRHDDATRKNIPTAEYQSVMRETEVVDQESGLGGQGSEVRDQRSENGGRKSKVRGRRT